MVKGQERFQDLLSNQSMLDWHDIVKPVNADQKQVIMRPAKMVNLFRRLSYICHYVPIHTRNIAGT
jgi:hypothetical protein